MCSVMLTMSWNTQHMQEDPMQLRFVTGNPHKAQELRAILRADITQLPLRLTEIQCLEVDQVVRTKAEQAYAHVDMPVLVEDTSLTFEVWNGLPGALIRWFMDTVGSHGMCQMLAGATDRRAIAICMFDLFDGHEHHLFSGMVRGTVADEPRGHSGFGWDDIFIPEGYTRTFAEMTADEKNSISMRRIALEQLRGFLDSRGSEYHSLLSRARQEHRAAF
jgi:XTP/dITP diphosphohydrolase